MTWRGIVFDLDGTLADSRLDFVAMRTETGCPPGVGLLEFIEALDSEEAQAKAYAVIHRHEMRGAEAATWIDGAEALCHRLAGSGMPIGVFTRNSRESAERMVQALDIPCDMLVAREDAAAKPAPEGLLKIASHFDLACEDMLCVGDFLFDLQAAAAAGMHSCLFDPRGDSPHSTHAELVIQRFSDLAELIYGESR
jgi:HAD superfamily hydrolase (TIGR01509 family)